MTTSNFALFTAFVLLSACSDQSNKVHYALPDDMTFYKIHPGDANQLLAEVYSQSSGNSSFPTYDLTQSWDRDISSIPIASIPSSINTSTLLRHQIINDIPAFSPLFKTQFYTQTETGELYLMGLQTSDTVYWIKNSSSNAYGILYLPANPATSELSFSESGTLQICNQTCVDGKGDISYSFSFLGTTTRKTLYATFDTLIFRTVTNIAALNEDKDINYQQDTQNFYTPLAGNIAEAVSFNNGLGEYSAILSKTNIKIDKKYIIE